MSGFGAIDATARVSAVAWAVVAAGRASHLMAFDLFRRRVG
jgi:hypothetical protein